MGARFRVFIVADNLRAGGSNRYCLELVSALSAHPGGAIDVTFLGLSSNTEGRPDTWLLRQAESAGISVEAIPAAGPYGLGAAMALSRRIPPQGPIILHSQEYRSNVVGRIVKLMRHDVAHVCTKHGFVIDPSVRHSLYVAIDRATAGFSDHYIAVCDDTARKLVDNWRLPAHNVTVVHNGLSVSSSEGRCRPQTPVEQRNGFFSVGYVGRLVWGKGLDDLIEAFRLALLEAPNLRLIVVGEGPLKNELRRRAGNLPVAFLGETASLRSTYSQMDLIVLPSHSEALPYVLLEAMRARVPVVATSVGGIPELISDGIHGILVPPANPQLLGAAIVRLARDGGLRGYLIEQARHRLETRFSSVVMARKTAAVYGQLVLKRIG